MLLFTVFDLFLVMFVLKVTDSADLSWWLVTSPLWLTAILVVIGVILKVVAEEGKKSEARK